MSKCNVEQLVVRKDMDINGHEKLFNITLRHGNFVFDGRTSDSYAYF